MAYKAWDAGVAQASGKFGGQGNQLQAILGLTDHQASISLSVDTSCVATAWCEVVHSHAAACVMHGSAPDKLLRA